MQSFTCLVKKEGHQYASLCIELDVASCGRTKTEAIEGLKNAIEAYIEYMVSENRGHEISRPVPMDELKEFLASPSAWLMTFGSTDKPHCSVNRAFTDDF